MRRKNEKRPARINRVAKALTQRLRKRMDKHHAFRKPLRRRESKPRIKRMIAYDLETTNIRRGTPRPLYLTACGEGFKISIRVFHLAHLLEILQTRFLLPELNGTRFVAWNGNNYDVYFVAAALLHDRDYILYPYLTRSKNLRGLRVELKTGEGEKKVSWEFLDGMAMTGIMKPLKKFLETFAPDFQKLEAPDFDTETFNPLHPEHIAYAERDSEGLYHGLVTAQDILQKNFGAILQPTIGNLGIRLFCANIPQSIEVWPVPYTAEEIIRHYVMRGGFCFANRHYFGAIWKYDINQAYAAAMRDCRLPAGGCTHSKGVNRYAHTAIYRITASHPKNTVPFYYFGEKRASCFGVSEITDTWITSVEYEQLRREGWTLKIEETFFWDSDFTMKEYVSKLETLRIAGGVKSAQGEMIKAIGNNSYGKTVERLDGLELRLALEKPPGFHEYQADDEMLQHIWFKFGTPLFRDFHQPQIGAFITAHVRMEVRRAILTQPAAWLYADTDCVIFDAPNLKLPQSPTLYGQWKAEVEGEDYWIIDKKVYAAVEGEEKHAKGMNLKNMSKGDFKEWFAGRPPEQQQIHRQNFMKVMTGAEMFIDRKKVGSKKCATAP